MLLNFADGSPFATAAAEYSYQPATGDITPRILLQVEFQDIPTTAIVDTGAPYVVCEPAVARLLDLDANSALEHVTLYIRGIRLQSALHRLTITLPANRGNSLPVEATVFVPDIGEEDGWGTLPSFLGLTGFLERLRFAVDPLRDVFYFGPL